MTVQQILAMTGEEFNTMSKSQLIEVNKVLAGAARKRLKLLPEGGAYEKLLHRANNTVNTGTDKTLFMSKGNIKISVSNKASFYDLKALRKELYGYLMDKTSTKRGYQKVQNQRLLNIISRFVEDPEEVYKKMPKEQKEYWTTALKDLDKKVTNTQLLNFGGAYFGWDSGNNGYKNAIEHCGGYKLMHSNGSIFTDRLKDYIRNVIEENIANATQAIIEQERQQEFGGNLVSHEENMGNIVAEERKNMGI